MAESIFVPYHTNPSGLSNCATIQSQWMRPNKLYQYTKTTTEGINQHILDKIKWIDNAYMYSNMWVLQTEPEAMLQQYAQPK